ncbi:MAG: CHAT domain-containing protein [Candidatus Eisenbacteria bacterium]|uniref:CHAT domain-containing protein n=1 Tax=Eiseniibacteriota bacterium TaxID=2212470 RepID=A0A933SEN7_UNCEI|nr:CHAT domain-containing protein [Candidatus Eisenbacteria bacterium]
MIRRLAPLALVLPLLAAAPSSASAAPADPWKTHAALVDRDNALYLAGQYAAIATLMDSVLAARGVTSDPGLLRLALTRRSRAHLMRFEYPAAREMSARACRLAEAARDSATTIRALRVRVVALEKTGDPDLARRLCARGAAIAKRRGQPRDESYFHMRHGYAFVAQGRSREALPWFRAAIAAGVRSGDEGDQLRAVAGLAAAQYQVGALREARESYARGIALAKKLDNPFELSYLCLNQADMEMAIGDPDLAPASANAAIEASRRASLLPVELQARRILANYEAARGAWDRVDSLMTATIALAEPLGDREPLSSALLLAAQARIQLGRPAEAEELMRRAVALVDTLIPVNAAFAAQNLVNNLHVAGRDADAVRYADELAARLVRRMPASSFWRMRFYRAHALQALGRHREALAGFREAAAASRPTATTPGGAEYDWALALAAESQRGLGHVDSSLAGFRRAIAAWEAARSARSREDLLLDSEDYGHDIGFAFANALLDPRRRVARDRRVIEAFSELQRFHALAVSERLLGPAAGAEARRKPFDFAAWRTATLRPGEVFVDVTPNDDSTLVIAVTRREVRAWMLPGQRALEKRLSRFTELGATSGADDPAVRPIAAALGEDFFGPGADLVRTATRVLLAGGRFGSYPIGALIVPGTNGPLMLERELSIVPSAKLLALSRARTSARPAAGRALDAGARTSAGRGRRLEAAGDEVRALGRDYRDALTLVDPRRTALQIAREALGTGGIVHLAAHTSVDVKRPWQSRMLLGDPGQGGAYLPVSSISRLRMSARLCVLASCRSLGTGGLDNMSLAGIAPAWLMAGVPTVVATQWDVDDRATAEFMRRFYVALARGGAVGAALQQAQREMRAMPEWSAPRFWAGFVVLGDPGTKVALAKR